MNSIKYIFSGLLLILLFNSCSPVKENKAEKATDVISAITASTTETGKPIDKVYCNNSSINSYALYLPKNYSKDKRWPVIFFFDPHASGKLPVKRYDTLAEKYGYVICCSNNSKNGLDIASIKNVSAEMMNDVFQNFFIDSNRVYAGGFSGGARVAATLAMSNNITGLICCGAGIQADMTFVNPQINYIGIAGKADFNYVELSFTDEQLAAANKLKHQLVVFDGKHEWPPLSIMEQAFLWLELDAMRNNLIKKDLALIETVSKQLKEECEKTVKEKNIYEQFNAYSKAVNYLNGLSDVSWFSSRKEQLKGFASLNQIIKQRKEQFVKEFNLQQKYMAAIPDKDLNWWQREVSTMKILADQNKEEAYTYKRLLNYLSLGAYMYSNDALSKNNLKMAETFLTLYELVDPFNSEHAYMRAVTAAEAGNQKEVFSFLEKTIQLGFNDRERLDADAAFSNIRNEEKFQKLADKIND